jgi:DNA-binding MarR family transcriptional regulator
MANQKRQDLLEAVTQAIYASSTAAVFFHSAIAEQLGIGPTEEKTLLLLSGPGAHSAGEIARHTGLTTASVTDLIDRLERKGFVRRVRDTKDRRRVIVEPNAERLAELAQVFGSFQGVFTDLLDAYSDEQLITIADYLNRAARYSREAITKLGQQAENQLVQRHHT